MDPNNVVDDVWIVIFDQVDHVTLAQLSLACRRFRDLATKPLLREVRWRDPRKALSNMASWEGSYRDLLGIPRKLVFGLPFRFCGFNSWGNPEDMFLYDRSITHLKRFISLREIHFTKTALTPHLYDVLRQIPTLQSLSITDCGFSPVYSTFRDMVYWRYGVALNHQDNSDFPWSEIPIRHLSLHRITMQPENDYSDFSPLHLITSSKLTSLDITWSQGFSNLYTLRRWPLPQLTTLNVTVPLHTREQTQSLMLLSRRCVINPRIKLTLWRQNLTDQQLHAMNFAIAGVWHYKGPLCMASFGESTPAINALSHVVMNEALDSPGVLEGLRGLPSGVTHLEIRLRRWDIEVLYAIRFLFPKIRSFIIRYGKGNLPQDLFVTIGSDILFELSELRAFKLVADSTCTTRGSTDLSIQPAINGGGGGGGNGGPGGGGSGNYGGGYNNGGGAGGGTYTSFFPPSLASIQQFNQMRRHSLPSSRRAPVTISTPTSSLASQTSRSTTSNAASSSSMLVDPSYEEDPDNDPDANMLRLMRAARRSNDVNRRRPRGQGSGSRGIANWDARSTTATAGSNALVPGPSSMQAQRISGDAIRSTSASFDELHAMYQAHDYSLYDPSQRSYVTPSISCRPGTSPESNEASCNELAFRLQQFHDRFDMMNNTQHLTSDQPPNTPSNYLQPQQTRTIHDMRHTPVYPASEAEDEPIEDNVDTAAFENVSMSAYDRIMNGEEDDEEEDDEDPMYLRARDFMQQDLMWRNGERFNRGSRDMGISGVRRGVGLWNRNRGGRNTISNNGNVWHSVRNAVIDVGEEIELREERARLMRAMQGGPMYGNVAGRNAQLNVDSMESGSQTPADGAGKGKGKAKAKVSEGKKDSGMLEKGKGKGKGKQRAIGDDDNESDDRRTVKSQPLPHSVTIDTNIASMLNQDEIEADAVASLIADMVKRESAMNTDEDEGIDVSRWLRNTQPSTSTSASLPLDDVDMVDSSSPRSQPGDDPQDLTYGTGFTLSPYAQALMNRGSTKRGRQAADDALDTKQSEERRKRKGHLSDAKKKDVIFLSLQKPTASPRSSATFPPGGSSYPTPDTSSYNPMLYFPSDLDSLTRMTSSELLDAAYYFDLLTTRPVPPTPPPPPPPVSTILPTTYMRIGDVLQRIADRNMDSTSSEVQTSPSTNTNTLDNYWQPVPPFESLDISGGTHGPMYTSTNSTTPHTSTSSSHQFSIPQPHQSLTSFFGSPPEPPLIFPQYTQPPNPIYNIVQPGDQRLHTEDLQDYLFGWNRFCRNLRYVEISSEGPATAPPSNPPSTDNSSSSDDETASRGNAGSRPRHTKKASKAVDGGEKKNKGWSRRFEGDGWEFGRSWDGWDE